MRASRLRHRVIIQEPVTTRSSTGAQTTTWTTHATVWASVEPVSGREFFSAQQVQSSLTTKIVIRYLSSVTPKMRVRHEADTASDLVNYYDIEAVIPVKERRHEMHLMCIKRGAEGFRSGA